MEIIIHRVNKIKDLKKIPYNYGVEIDIRSYGSNLILNHEPYTNGDNLKNYLKYYNHGTLILNIKEAGIEDDVIKLVKKEKIDSYFLLDVEMPYLYNSSLHSNKNIAVRFSEYENILLSKFFQKKIKWIWIDTVTKLPINTLNLKTIKKFKSCLVCPERWDRKQDIIKYFKKLKKLNFFPNAVMTSKNSSDIWNSLLLKEKSINNTFD